MGGIYTLGPSEGTVVRNNVFHDIYSNSYGGWGMYTDEGSTGILFENNLVYRTKTGSFHQHYGKDNVLRNNILACSKEQQIQATRAEDHLSFTLEKNIIYWHTGILLAGAWDRLQFASRDNLYWQALREPITFMGKSLAHGRPRVMKKARRSPTRSFSIRPTTIIALRPIRQPCVWASSRSISRRPAFMATRPGKRRPARLAIRRWKIPPGPPPVEINDDFENQPVGSRPGGAVSHVENRGDAIVITDEAAAGGKQSVKIVDAPGLKNVFDPHLTYENLGHKTGRIYNSFDLRVANDTRLNFEWRDYGEPPYATGPQFAIARSAAHVRRATSWRCRPTRGSISRSRPASARRPRMAGRCA